MNQNHTQFEIGERVQVSDGRPRPPDRFNRKLAAWKDRNYTGHVHEIGEARDYAPYGTLTMKRDDYPDSKYRGMITFQFTIMLGGDLVVHKLKEVQAA